MPTRFVRWITIARSPRRPVIRPLASLSRSRQPEPPHCCALGHRVTVEVERRGANPHANFALRETQRRGFLNFRQPRVGRRLQQQQTPSARGRPLRPAT
ncbi:hypothetical protein MRX96_058250 [Rhipicephalus microplus]